LAATLQAAAGWEAKEQFDGALGGRRVIDLPIHDDAVATLRIDEIEATAVGEGKPEQRYKPFRVVGHGDLTLFVDADSSAAATKQARSCIGEDFDHTLSRGLTVTVTVEEIRPEPA
jgi:hypothetical protein